MAHHSHQGTIENTIRAAFHMAHLLTASTQQAESAVMEGIRLWDPSAETDEMLYQYVLHAAVSGEPKVGSSRNKPISAGPFLPEELQAVLGLSANLRRCFVLRVLAGFPRQVCARLLHLHATVVDECTSAAAACLAALDERSEAPVELSA